MHLVPGNHDVGDKRVDWMPADQVCGDYLDIYRGAFGADYHAFDRENLRFVFLNSLLLNSGLPQEQAQKQWFEAQMDGADDKRVFLFMHYPVHLQGGRTRQLRQRGRTGPELAAGADEAAACRRRVRRARPQLLVRQDR